MCPLETPRPTEGSAFKSAFHYLGRRDHSVAELRAKLRRKGYPMAEVDSAIDRLLERGYLNDETYATALIVRRSTTRGRIAIAAELATKGVSRELIEEQLSSRLSHADQLRAALLVAEGWPDLDPARLSGRLQRRGFDGSVIQSVLEQARS
ncbi:MAG: regulatory protein RecX [Candidatus Dormibacteraceae bacterium]